MAQPTQQPQKSTFTLSIILWLLIFIFAMALAFARLAMPQTTWLTIATAVPLVALLGYQAFLNQQTLKTRTMAFGINSLITVLLVIGIVAVLNFLVSRYPQKLDLTKNKVHTLSDQTVKVVKGLKSDVQADFYSRFNERDQFRPLLDDYKDLNPKFHVDYVDPNREPTRAQAAGVKKWNTLVLSIGDKKQTVDDPSEEKVTNALVKLTKEKSPTLCAITGHGEKSFESTEAEGYSQSKKGLTDQAYQVKTINVLNEKKIPADCDGIAIIGPNKPLIGDEAKWISEYLAGGGRAIVALDVDVRGAAETAPEVISILKDWHVNPALALIVDPNMRGGGMEPTVPVITDFSREHAITKEFPSGAIATLMQGIMTLFPQSRPIEIASGAPAGMNVTWLARTSPQSWGVVNLKKLAHPGAIKPEAEDKKGPLNVAVAVNGKQKDSKAARNTRLVVFGNSFFANNQFRRYGLNSDLFLNSVSWILEDESMISIRAKDTETSRVDISQQQFVIIGLLTVFVIPILIVGAGIAIWVWRRRL